MVERRIPCRDIVIDARPGGRNRSLAKRIKVIDAGTGSEVEQVFAIDTRKKEITVRGQGRKPYAVGDYILRDMVTGEEWLA